MLEPAPIWRFWFLPFLLICSVDKHQIAYRRQNNRKEVYLKSSKLRKILVIGFESNFVWLQLQKKKKRTAVMIIISQVVWLTVGRTEEMGALSQSHMLCSANYPPPHTSWGAAQFYCVFCTCSCFCYLGQWLYSTRCTSAHCTKNNEQTLYLWIIKSVI